MYKILISVFLCLSANVIMACSCVMPGPISVDELIESPLVFYGTVMSVDEEVPEKRGGNPFGGSLRNKKVQFKISTVVFGDKSADEVMVVTGASSASCGINFIVGEEWIVWTYDGGDELHTGICTRSARKEKMDKHHKNLVSDFLKHKKNKKWCDKDKNHNAEGSVMEGKPYGKWIVFYDTGDVKYTGAYKDGKKHGLWKYNASREDAYRWVHDSYPAENTKLEEYVGVTAMIRRFDNGILVEEKEVIKGYGRRH